MEVALLIDLGLSAFILLFIVGSRFNTWPSVNPRTCAGLPRDYINPLRYSVFFAGYIATFVLFILVLRNLGVVISASAVENELDPLLQHVETALGRHSFTYMALILTTALNMPRVNTWDEIWRNKLQQWARIPKAVEDARTVLMEKDDAFRPDLARLFTISQSLEHQVHFEHWERVFQQLHDERKRMTLNWRYVKALYLLGVVKDIGLDKFNVDDIRHVERRLKDMGRLIPALGSDAEAIHDAERELERITADFYEGICKFIIRKYPSKAQQYTALRRFGLHISFDDVPEIRLFEAGIFCVFGLALVSAVTVCGFLVARDQLGIPRGDGGSWFTWERLIRWTLGGTLSYVIAIAVGIFLEKISQAKQATPGLWLYAIAVFIGTLGSFTYFEVIRDISFQQAPPQASLGFLALALSFGVTATLAIRSLSNVGVTDHRDVLASTLRHATALALVTALLQLVVTVSLAGGIASRPALMVSVLFGLLKGFGVGFVVSYAIQESIRRQLNSALRSHPRKRHVSRLRAWANGRQIEVITRNISRTGLLIREH
ncbi:MAG: hypothetical protein LPK85_07025, partial [Gammaproteobacteria bacterium]|nr:hypothetical protein [Gammaproteobacteria bacterium]